MTYTSCTVQLTDFSGNKIFTLEHKVLPTIFTQYGWQCYISLDDDKVAVIGELTEGSTKRDSM